MIDAVIWLKYCFIYEEYKYNSLSTDYLSILCKMAGLYMIEYSINDRSHTHKSFRLLQKK